MNKRLAAGAVALVGLGVAAGIILVSNFGGGYVSSLFAGGVKNIGSKNPPVAVGAQAKAINDAFIAASKAINPIVVSVSVVGEKKVSSNQQLPDFFRFFGDPRNPGGDDEENDRMQRVEGAGSGVIISEDGYILTNNHVVEDAKEDGIKIIMHDRKEYKAQLIGRDPLTDIAVLKIDVSGLPAAHFGNSDEVQVGEWVIAVGNPLGLRSTVTTGIVSAIGRGQLNLNKDRYAVEDFIQTDAAINPGNSGGGLFDLEGSLVGINTAIASRTGYYSGYGFAIPVNMAKSVALDLIEDGKVDRGYIGVSIRSVDEITAKSYKLDNVAGVLVEDVLKGSPAEKAGVEREDIILDIDGTPVNTANELQSRVTMHRVGDMIKLKVWRDGKTIYKNVTLQPKENGKLASAKTGDDESDADNADNNKPVTFKSLGFTVAALTDKQKSDNEVESGVAVMRVDQYSSAVERGLVPNGIILKADKTPVKSPAQFKKLIDAKRGDIIRLQVKYREGTRLVFLEIPKENS
ncbi:DegQ family serine endoprotease [Ignavibacteria bacterium]|nr:Do family serine endopeptidase [Bacteroidota bacterium]MCZ2133178.1 Do family serine endopeptidase [Bacteroidota bacterium]